MQSLPDLLEKLWTQEVRRHVALEKAVTLQGGGMATNDSSNPAGQVVPELVEILKRLGAHRRALHEQTYGNPPWTREQSDAYFYHPLVRACDWLEQRMGISRHDLEDAAFRLTTSLRLRGMDPLPGPNGEPDKEDKGQPDWLWMIPKFRELDRDGTTARLWQLLVEKYPAILEEAGVPTETCDDDSAYVPATLLMKERDEIMSHPKLNRWLKKHPNVRKRNPSRNRLEIHAGDWHHAWKEYDRLQDEALDGEALAERIANTESRKATERARTK